MTRSGIKNVNIVVTWIPGEGGLADGCAAVASDHISRSRVVGAVVRPNGIGLGAAVNVYAGPARHRPAQSHRPRHVRPDEISRHPVIVGPAARDFDANEVSRNDIFCSGYITADRVAGRAALDKHATTDVRQDDRAGDVRADVVAFDYIAAVAEEVDAVAGIAIDDQPIDRAVAGGDGESGHARAGAGAIQFDNRRPGKTRLRGSVDPDGCGNVRQHTGRLDGIWARAGDVKANKTASLGVRFGDGIPQRTWSAVVGVRHDGVLHLEGPDVDRGRAVTIAIDNARKAALIGRQTHCQAITAYINRGTTREQSQGFRRSTVDLQWAEMGIQRKGDGAG